MVDRDSHLQVLPGEELRATIYEFRSDNNALVSVVTLTKMSLRRVYHNNSIPRATPFRTAKLACGHWLHRI
jgi:hypothetical protein